MPFDRALYYTLWVTPALVQACLLALMARRKLRREFPRFFSYTVLQVCSFPLLYGVFRYSPQQYFYVYWTVGALSVGLGFAVIHEVFNHVFRPYSGLRDLGSLLFRWAGLVLVLVGVVVAASSSGAGPQRVVAGVLALERSVRLMQCGLILFLFLFSAYLGLNWRHYVFGIALGFGLFASVEMILVTLWTQLGPSANAILSLVKSSTYLFSTLIWAGYMLSPQPERKVRILPQPTSDRWDFALAAIINPAGQVPVVQSIEKTVDRVLNGNGKHSAVDLGPLGLLPGDRQSRWARLLRRDLS